MFHVERTALHVEMTGFRRLMGEGLRLTSGCSREAQRFHVLSRSEVLLETLVGALRVAVFHVERGGA